MEAKEGKGREEEKRSDKTASRSHFQFIDLLGIKP